MVSRIFHNGVKKKSLIENLKVVSFLSYDLFLYPILCFSSFTCIFIFWTMSSSPENCRNAKVVRNPNRSYRHLWGNRVIVQSLWQINEGARHMMIFYYLMLSSTIGETRESMYRRNATNNMEGIPGSVCGTQVTRDAPYTDKNKRANVVEILHK